MVGKYPDSYQIRIGPDDQIEVIRTIVEIYRDPKVFLESQIEELFVLTDKCQVSGRYQHNGREIEFDGVFAIGIKQEGDDRIVIGLMKDLGASPRHFIVHGSLDLFNRNKYENLREILGQNTSVTDSTMLHFRKIPIDGGTDVSHNHLRRNPLEEGVYGSYNGEWGFTQTDMEDDLYLILSPTEIPISGYNFPRLLQS